MIHVEDALLRIAGALNDADADLKEAVEDLAAHLGVTLPGWWVRL